MAESDLNQVKTNSGSVKQFLTIYAQHTWLYMQVFDLARFMKCNLTKLDPK